MSERDPFPIKPTEIGAFEPSDPSQARSDLAGAKVTVACKLPHGLILQRWRWVDRAELVMGGGTRQIKAAEPTGEFVVLHGSAVPFGVVPNYEIVAGYGLTHNVDRDLWEHWQVIYAAMPAFKNGLIFAFESLDHVRGRAKEMAGQRTGLEPIDPGNLLGDERVKAIGIRRGLTLGKAT